MMSSCETSQRVRNKLKIPLVAAAALVVASLTAPWWGGCGFYRALCGSWCLIRHFDSNLNELTCKAGCAADEVSCRAR